MISFLFLSFNNAYTVSKLLLSIFSMIASCPFSIQVTAQTPWQLDARECICSNVSTGKLRMGKIAVQSVIFCIRPQIGL
jgi:hypothetical protein